MTAGESSTRVLGTARKRYRVNFPAAMELVRAETGKHKLRQFMELAALTLRRGGVNPEDYFKYALYRPDLTREARRAYISNNRSSELNRAVSPPGLAHSRGLMGNKILCALLAAEAGHAVPEVLAIAATDPPPQKFRSLGTAAAIWAFLREAPLPLFGKPVNGSHGSGVMSLFSRSNDGETGVMGDGREVLLDVLAGEIAKHYPQGYVFQQFIDQHDDIAAFSSGATATLRLVTLLGETGPELLYGLWKVPGKALADNFMGLGAGAYCALDGESGTVIRAQSGHRIEGKADLTHHPLTGKALPGFRVPLFAEACAMAADLHLLFPGHGIIGCDIAIGKTAPVFIEANANPFHAPYQIAFGEGLMNVRFAPRIDALIVRQSALVKAARKKRGRK